MNGYDIIANWPAGYAAYIQNLYNALSDSDDDDEPAAKDEALVKKLIDLSKTLPTNEADATNMIKAMARQYGYKYSYEPNDSYNTDPKLRTPTHKEVDKLVDKMKRACTQ